MARGHPTAAGRAQWVVICTQELAAKPAGPPASAIQNCARICTPAGPLGHEPAIEALPWALIGHGPVIRKGSGTSVPPLKGAFSCKKPTTWKAEPPAGACARLKAKGVPPAKLPAAIWIG